MSKCQIHIHLGMEETLEKKQNTAPNPANLMSVQDYARMMGVKRQTIYNWLKDDKVKLVDFLGKKFIDKSTYQNV